MFSSAKNLRRIRKDYAPENLALLGQLVLTLLKQERSAKHHLKGKHLMAGLNETYLFKMLMFRYDCPGWSSYLPETL